MACVYWQVGNPGDLNAEWQAVASERDELRRRQNMLKGALAHIRDAVKTAERELSAHTYVGIDSKYRKQLIELRTTEMAGNDLEKYHKVRLHIQQQSHMLRCRLSALQLVHDHWLTCLSRCRIRGRASLYHQCIALLLHDSMACLAASG